MIQNKIKIGIIGGSGLDDPKVFLKSKQVEVDSPYGKPSSGLVEGEIEGKSVAILIRHGKNHAITPTEVPYRANIWALKQIGCTHIVATTACGSLTEQMKPGDFVFIDQFIDFTKLRKLSFFDNFENGVVHAPMAHPFDEKLRQVLIETATELGLPYHKAGTMVTIEGPRFSTKAESLMYRQWGADLINMSTVPEVVLANELGIPYQSIAMVTDYDCWKDGEESVSVELVFKRMRDNSVNAIQLLCEAIGKI